jgi:hypothetical protein
MDLGETEWGGVEWIGLAQAQDRERWGDLVNTVMNLSGGKLSSGSTTGGLSSSAQIRRVSRVQSDCIATI